MKVFYTIKKHLKLLEITPDNGLVLQFLNAIMNLASIGILSSLVSQCIIGTELSLSISL